MYGCSIRMKRCTSILLLLAIVVVMVCPILPLHLHRIIRNPDVAPACTLEMLITGVPHEMMDLET
jgi:hypothetical protein